MITVGPPASPSRQPNTSSLTSSSIDASRGAWQTDITEARLDQPLAEGASFDWSTYGMVITSTVYALDEGFRILWGGQGNGITGIHEWTFTEVPNGVRVTTAESFTGGPVEADTATMQRAPR
jgi:hypothetical protein